MCFYLSLDEEKTMRNYIKEDENDFGREDSAREDSVDEDDNKLVIKEEPESQDEIEDNKNVSTASSCNYNLSQFKSDESRFEDSNVKEEQDDSDEDMPLVGTYF